MLCLGLVISTAPGVLLPSEFDPADRAVWVWARQLLNKKKNPTHYCPKPLRFPSFSTVSWEMSHDKIVIHSVWWKFDWLAEMSRRSADYALTYEVYPQSVCDTGAQITVLGLVPVLGWYWISVLEILPKSNLSEIKIVSQDFWHTKACISQMMGNKNYFISFTFSSDFKLMVQVYTVLRK